MAQGNRAAIYVQPRVLEADRVPGRNRDGGKGLVDLPDVDVVCLEVSAGQGFPDRGDCAVEHDRRVRARDAGRYESRAGFQVQFPRLVGSRHEDPAGAVVDTARVARRDPAIRLERGREGRELLQRRGPTRVLVRVEHSLVATLVEHGDGFDLLLETALGDRPDRLAVVPERELVHLLSRDLVLSATRAAGVPR